MPGLSPVTHAFHSAISDLNGLKQIHKGHYLLAFMKFILVSLKKEQWKKSYENKLDINKGMFYRETWTGSSDILVFSEDCMNRWEHKSNWWGLKGSLLLNIITKCHKIKCFGDFGTVTRCHFAEHVSLICYSYMCSCAEGQLNKVHAPICAKGARDAFTAF